MMRPYNVHIFDVENAYMTTRAVSAKSREDAALAVLDYARARGAYAVDVRSSRGTVQRFYIEELGRGREDAQDG